MGVRPFYIIVRLLPGPSDCPFPLAGVLDLNEDDKLFSLRVSIDLSTVALLTPLFLVFM